MASLRDIAIRWYRKAFGAPAGTDIRDQGLDTVLDGNAAVAISEEAAGSRIVASAEGPRGVVAAATGLALAGKRATACLSGPDIATAQDLLIAAAGRHAPLVLHLSTRAAAAHGGALGSAHDTVHLSADSGCFVLVADTVQQAVDFTFVARRVAEETLVPGVVVMDDEQTAHAPQDVTLLSPTQAARFVGAARDVIDAPTAAQKLLFGDTRRRLPIWHDLDEPMLTGAVFDRQGFALGAAARRTYFDEFVSESLSRALAEFAAVTGRDHDTVSQHRIDGAKIVLVAQGAGIETVRLAADALRKQHKLRVGVAGVHALRPFPRAALAAALGEADRVFVLERGDTALSAEPPLTREVRASLYAKGRQPDCGSVVYGVGGLPLRPADVVSLCVEGAERTADPLFLGIAFDDDAGDQPKRAVLLDALRRAYPDAGRRGMRATAPDAPSQQANTLAITIRHDGREALTGAAAAVLHALEGGRIRSRCGENSDWLVHGDALLDPGDEIEPDVTLDVARRQVTLHDDGRRYGIAAGEPADDTLLGGLFGVLLRAGKLDAKARRVAGVRRGMLDALPAEQRDAAMDAFQAGLDNIEEIETDEPAAPKRRDSVPPAVRELGRSDDRVASLPRFWDQTGILYRDGRTDRLTADPFLASGSMPPLTATFGDAGERGAWLPVLDPAACTGCGDCWTHCPDSAIGVVAAGPAALIDAGIRRTGAEAVRQVAGKLASRIIASNRKTETPPATFGEMLDEAFAWLLDKAPLPDDRKHTIQEGIAAIVAEFGALPAVVAKPFFHDAEAKKKDSAELLSIVVNADACQSCGICIRACEPGALQPQDVDDEFLDASHALWETWSATPDTTGDSLERAAGHGDIGPAAAMLLTRACQFALAGSNVGEPGSGEKAAVRLALAATEYHQQPVVQRFANELADAGEQLAGRIRDTLSGTLPVEDLDAISEQLESLSSPRVDLSTLAERVAGGDADHSVDTAHLLRLIELSKELATAHHRLTTGEHGLGRARYGLAITGHSMTSWAARFPANPFQVPVAVDSNGDAAQLAAGLVEGHLDETTELVRMLRLARLEIERPDGLDFKRDALANLQWQDLADDELDLCPPLLLVGSDDMLAGRGLAQLIWLLNSGLPVKVLLLSALDLSPVDVGMLALAQRHAYVAQSSIADADHLHGCLSDALSFRGPALIQVYTPSPSRDGFAAERCIELARDAVEARALPLFRYDPRHEGVFGTRISLDRNPASAELTVADWARAQSRFASSSDSDLERAADHCAQTWQTLQELAGDVTPFTEKVEAEIRAEVAAEHQGELDAQQQAAAAELAAARDKTKAEIAGKLRSRLLELASRRRDP